MRLLLIFVLASLCRAEPCAIDFNVKGVEFNAVHLSKTLESYRASHPACSFVVAHFYRDRWRQLPKPPIHGGPTFDGWRNFVVQNAKNMVPFGFGVSGPEGSTVRIHSSDKPDFRTTGRDLLQLDNEPASIVYAALAPDGWNVFVKHDDRPLTLDTVRRIDGKIFSMFGAWLHLYVRSDPWFVFQSYFPYFLPGTTTPLPDRATYRQDLTGWCFSAGTDRKCDFVQ